MRRLGLVGLGLVAVAVVEIVVLVFVAQHIGMGLTLLLLLATTLFGGWLLRREGSRAWRRFRLAADAGRPPGGEASRGLVGLLAALLLVVPGLLTDLVGLALLVPPVRAGAVRLVQRGAERRLSPTAAGDLFGPRKVRVRDTTPSRAPRAGAPGGDGDADAVIEGEIVD